jgi:hypothetical protein
MQNKLFGLFNRDRARSGRKAGNASVTDALPENLFGVRWIKLLT